MVKNIQIYEFGLEIFSIDYLKGISFLMLFDYLRPDVKSIASFLYSTAALKRRTHYNKKLQYQVGNFLTS